MGVILQSTITCPRCGHGRHATLERRALLQCNRCKHQVSLTAGTIFHATKLPLVTWFQAIYHLSQSKGGVSSIELGRRLGVRQPTAWLMKHKLMQVMKERDDSQPLAGVIQLDDAYWGGERRGGKRGRGAANKSPFVAAVATNEEGHPIAMRLSSVNACSEKFRRSNSPCRGATCSNLPPTSPSSSKKPSAAWYST